MAELCVQERPNGKVYRARKGPVVEAFGGDWPENDCIMVLRVSEENQGLAYRLACEEAARVGCDYVNRGHFGWWRASIRDHEPYWDYDSDRGMPGWYFHVE